MMTDADDNAADDDDEHDNQDGADDLWVTGVAQDDNGYLCFLQGEDSDND